MKPVATQNRPGFLPRAIAIVVTTTLLLTACGQPAAGPEEQLREWLVESQAAVETKQRRTLVELISPAYHDAKGYERDDIANLLRMYFLRQNTIKLLTSIDEIRVFGETAAEIDLTVGMAGTNEGVFGFNADAYNFELELEQDRGDWLLISARWGELGTELH